MQATPQIGSFSLNLLPGPNSYTIYAVDQYGNLALQNRGDIFPTGLSEHRAVRNRHQEYRLRVQTERHCLEFR